MNTNELRQAIRLSVKLKRPLMIWGSPGIGKSQVVQGVAEEFGECIDFRAPMHDTVDVMGLPSTKDGHTIWNRPDFIREDGKGILFIDELPQASPAMQAALSQLILDRKCGPHKLGDGWAIIAAGNRQTDKCGTHRMLEHIKSRMIHVELDVDVDAWCQWAIQNDIAPEVIGFVRFKNDALSKFDPKVDQRAYPCPRAWEAVSGVLSVDTRQGDSTPDIDDESAQNGLKRYSRAHIGNIEQELIAGTIGDGTAAEFKGFCDLARELPSPDVILTSPKTAPVPDSPAAKYAVASTLASRATVDNIQAVLQYVDRLDPEFAVMTVVDIVRGNNAEEILTNQAMVTWYVEHKDVLT